MPYPFAVDLDALFEERRPQMIGRGLPELDVDHIRSSVRDMWGDGQGTWAFEWSSLARRYVEQGNDAAALLAYGYAKFPTLADEPRRAAYREQIDLCVSMAEADPVDFERRVIEIDAGDAVVPVTVHRYTAPGADCSDAPVLLASGGVDMWKDDLHAVWCACATWAGVSVLAFDIPGTGESTVPMSLESTKVISGLVAEAQRMGNGRVAHFGISMGGYFSARTGLTAEVDAAVVLGGPVVAAFDAAPVGAMTSIVGSALGFDAAPTTEKLIARWEPMSLRGELEMADRDVPMLVVNGANDPLIPQADTLVFEGRPGAEVHLIPDSGHCAAEKLGEVTPMIIGWLGRTMADLP